MDRSSFDDIIVFLHFVALRIFVLIVDLKFERSTDLNIRVVVWKDSLVDLDRMFLHKLKVVLHVSGLVIIVGVFYYLSHRMSESLLFSSAELV